jgi:hypothetical protein
MLGNGQLSLNNLTLCLFGYGTYQLMAGASGWDLVYPKAGQRFMQVVVSYQAGITTVAEAVLDQPGGHEQEKDDGRIRAFSAPGQQP